MATVRPKQSLISSGIRSNAIKTADIRRSFVDYFKSKEHKEIVSSPVIPFDDPTLLFINAGMNQFKDIFTGKKKSEYPRAVTVQKCMRAGGKHNDLENVGKTARHHTFFEMLGNFSFGDYFKEKAITMAWEWVTQTLSLPKDRLYATVYKDDDEAFNLWAKIAPELKNGRILRFGKKDNYWTMGEIGPCGPCSEIHYDRGKKFGDGPNDTVNGETDRFVEIWNLVFMQFEQKPGGILTPLPKPSVDTGAGLERIACILQNGESNYEIDIFRDLISHIEEITGKKYHSDSRGVSHRVIADHIRALTFCIADGAGISNEKQGYVLRRILRRAARHGRLLEMKESFLWRLVPELVRLMGDTYPEINERMNHISRVIKTEEESFGRTLDTGLELFSQVADRAQKSKDKVIPGEEVFRLYDTYGFPVDMTQLMAEESGLNLDMPGFERLMSAQQEKSREGGGFKALEDMIGAIEDTAAKAESKDKNKSVKEFDRNHTKIDNVAIKVCTFDSFPRAFTILEKTPFYAESGGQVTDIGFIYNDKFRIRIDTVQLHRGHLVHIGEVVSGTMENIGDGMMVTAEVDLPRRRDIMRNHTATHLLHAALRKVLGEHVKQSGSYVGPDKLRFDFSHFKPLSPEEKTEVERLVNERVLIGSQVATVEDDLENAKKSGAMAIFGEKYDSRVRVVSIDNFSKELCGGTHVDNVADIGPFMITLETGIASGVRRIEAITGSKAVEKMLAQRNDFIELAAAVNRPVEETVSALKEIAEQNRELQKEIKRLKAEKFSTGDKEIGNKIEIDGLEIRFNDFQNSDREEITGWVDLAKSLNRPSMYVATGTIDNKQNMFVSTSAPAALTFSLHSGNISREVLAKLGGRGGGKENFAQGSIPVETSIDKIIDVFRDVLKKYLENKRGNA